MIRYLETISPERLEELRSFCSSDAFGVKAIGPVLSYGTGYEFVDAWEQRDGEGSLTAFVSRFYGSTVVCGSDRCDREELEAFLRVIGAQTLLGPEVLLPSFREQGKTGPVMCLPGGDAWDGPSDDLPGNTALVFDDRLRDVYDVLAESDFAGSPDRYDAFLTDLSHRIRHGTAHTVLLLEGDEPAAVSAILVELPDALFCGAVATRPAFRGKHYASACLRALRERRPDCPLFLLCREEMQPFYERFGLSVTGRYLEIDPGRP